MGQKPSKGATASMMAPPSVEYSIPTLPEKERKQIFLIVGGQAIVIYEALKDQIVELYSSTNCTEENLLQECDSIITRLNQYFEYLSDYSAQFSNSKEKLIGLWKNSKFRTGYEKKKFEIDPYLVLPHIIERLSNNKGMNLKRFSLFKPASNYNESYRTIGYSKNAEDFKSEKAIKYNDLPFEFFANCFRSDTWADVASCALPLSDFNNEEFIKEYFQVFTHISRFNTYRMVLILTHLDIFYEKIKSGIKYERIIDKNIRSELHHLPKDIALYVNSFISEVYQLLKQSQDTFHYPNRTYEFHIINTFNDGDMRNLLDCLCIGREEKRRCFISSDFNFATFPISSRPDPYSLLQLKQLCDVVIVQNGVTPKL